MAKKGLSVKSIQALETLRAKNEPLTFSEIDVENLNPAHMTALVNAELVSATRVEKEVPTVVKRKVNIYALTEKGRNFTPEKETE